MIKYFLLKNFIKKLDINYEIKYLKFNFKFKIK